MHDREHGDGRDDGGDAEHTHQSFDERAATWDDSPMHTERAAAVAAAIRGAVALDAGMRVLEYGAGTGLLSQALAADVGHITVTDPSAGMREVVAAKIAAGVLPDARVGMLDLEREPVPDERYDLIVTMMALHHIEHVPRVLAGFATLLAPGGALCIADLEADDGSFHANSVPPADGGFHVHDGFDRDELAARLAGVGLGEVRFESCYEIERENGTYGVFLATCRRP